MPEPAHPGSYYCCKQCTVNDKQYIDTTASAVDTYSDHTLVKSHKSPNHGDEKTYGFRYRKKRDEHIKLIRNRRYIITLALQVQKRALHWPTH